MVGVASPQIFAKSKRGDKPPAVSPFGANNPPKFPALRKTRHGRASQRGDKQLVERPDVTSGWS